MRYFARYIPVLYSVEEMQALEQLAYEHGGVYTDGRFPTLNSVIEEERADIKVAGVTVHLYHTHRQSLRPSMTASFWRFRAVIPGKRRLRLRLRRRVLGRHRWPWQRVLCINAEHGVRWELRGRTRLPHPAWAQHPAFTQALSQTIADSIFLKPHRLPGTVLEMHLRGTPRDYSALEEQWQAYLRLMECVLLTD